MARIRSIKPEFFTDQTLSSLSVEARLTFIGLWTEADDAGRMIDSPKLLAGSLWPHDKKITAARMEKLLVELAEAGRIERYQVGSERFIQVTNWHHQKISHPTASKLPSPSGNAPESVGSGSGESPEGFAPSRAPADQGTGNREQGGAHKPVEPPNLGADLAAARPSRLPRGTHAAGDALLQEWRARQDPKRANVIGNRTSAGRVVGSFLDAGHPPEVVAAMLDETPSITPGAMNVALSKIRRRTEPEPGVTFTTTGAVFGR